MQHEVSGSQHEGLNDSQATLLTMAAHKTASVQSSTAASMLAACVSKGVLRRFIICIAGLLCGSRLSVDALHAMGDTT